MNPQIDQAKLAALARTNPQLAAAILMRLQGLSAAPPGMAPQHTGSFLSRSTDTFQAGGRPSNVPRASGDSPIPGGSVLSQMSDEIRRRQAAQSSLPQQLMWLLQGAGPGGMRMKVEE